MTVHMIPLDEGQKAQLDALAAEREESAADLATRALVAFLDHEAEFKAAVEEGLAAVERGEVRDLDDAVRDLRTYMAARTK